MLRIKIMIIGLLGLFHAQGFAMAAAGAGAAGADARAEQIAQAKRVAEYQFSVAVRWADVEMALTLLKDPVTTISNQRANSHNLIDAMKNGSEQSDPSKDKKILKLLLFFGFNPTYKELGEISAQEAAHKLDSRDKDYSTWMDDYKNIEKYCSEQELTEFRAIKKERLEQERIKKYKKFANLALREIGKSKSHKIAKKLAVDSAASFAWPQKDLKKDSN